MKYTQNIGLGKEGKGIRIDLGYSHDISDYEIFEMNFYNLDAFLEGIITIPINFEVFPYPTSIYGGKSFTGTNSFEEAWNLCKFTQDEGYEYFSEGLNHINFKKSEIAKPTERYNVVGYSPNVSKLLCGNPCNMKIKKNDIKKGKITVDILAGFSSSTRQKQIIHRGICIMNLIQYLEKKGFDVTLNYEDTSVSENQMIKINVPLKRDSERLNIKMCYFPLVNPSFSRRLLFRAMECIQGLNDSWSGGYGYPYKKNDEEILSQENTIYISTPIEMGIEGYQLDKDFDCFVKYIDEKYGLYELEKEGNEKCYKKTYGKKV